MNIKGEKMIEISMAVVVHDDKILIAQRKKGKFPELMWEFPGGKLEQGETLEECVAREFKEELEKEITVKNLFMSHVHTYENKGDFRLNAFWATCQTDTLPALHEHNDAKWVALTELNNFEFCPADIPFITALKELKSLPVLD